MRDFNWGAVVFSALFALQGIGGGYANAAGEIHFLINVGGTEQEVDVSAPDTKLNLKPSYTVNGVTINFDPASSGSAYIDLNENEEWLALRNARIYSTTSVLNEVRFTFWREFSAPPSGAGVTYHVQAAGYFKRGTATATGARVAIRGSIEQGGTPLGVIASRVLPPSIICPNPQSNDPTTRCITTSYLIPWNQAADSSPFTLSSDTTVKRTVKAQFWLTTVQKTDYLLLQDTSTAGIVIGGGPPNGPGTAEDQCATCSGTECDTCLIEGWRCTHVCPPDHPPTIGKEHFLCRWFGWFCARCS